MVNTPSPDAAASKDQLHTLRHMLGINTPEDRVPKPYRDYGAVNPGDAKFVEMERIGLVEIYRRSSSANEYDYYRCTPKGRALAMASHKTIRLKKSSRVYSKFLDVRDALGGLSFKEFLTNPEFAETRKSA